MSAQEAIGVAGDNFTYPGSPPPPEGSHATKKRRSGATSVVKKRGRRRGARSMGRYPLRTAIDAYMEANKAYLAEETLSERGRKLRAFANRYEAICSANPGLKRDPAKWTEEEVTAVIVDTKRHGWSLETQAKELGSVQALLRFVGNGAMDRMRTAKPHMFPRRMPSRGPSLKEADLRKVIETLGDMTGWMGEVARFYIATLAYTGLRPGELRKAQMDDLDLSGWTLRVSHPKGESSYGRSRRVPIPTPLRPIVLEYIRARDRMLAEQGLVGATPLVCTMRGTTYSSKQLRFLKRKVSERCGVGFELRALRRTYGQVLLNRGVSIETVSLTLGHASTRTTETYYCRKDADSAKSEVLRAFTETRSGPSAENPLIEKRELITGYG